MKLMLGPSAAFFSLTLCHMKPMLLLVSQRRFASNLQQRAEHHMTQGFFSPFSWSAGFSGSPKCHTWQQIVKRTHNMGSDLRMGEQWWEGYTPPGYFLLPFLRCSRHFLLLLASHKVTAVGGLGDVHSELFEWRRGGRQRDRTIRGHKSVFARTSHQCSDEATADCLRRL